MRIKITLEYEKLVYKEIALDEKKDLTYLHQTIIKLFNLKKDEIGSFFLTDDKLNLIKEIPLISMQENDKNMDSYMIESVLHEAQNSLIYIYDFMHMWRFHIEIISLIENKTTDLQIIKEIGEPPKNAPQINFENQQL